MHKNIREYNAHEAKEDSRKSGKLQREEEEEARGGEDYKEWDKCLRRYSIWAL
jgi:hypothetical protein